MPKTRIFFTTDIHGSEQCFIKFLNAAKFYKADILILGGDITGKAIVPIIQQGSDLFSAYFLGQKHVLKGFKKLDELEEKIKVVGFYPYRTNAKEWDDITANSQKFNELFIRLQIETLKKWIKLAEERLKQQKIKVFICPGNDDTFEIDDILNESDYVVNPDGRIVEIDDYHTMIAIGNSNITPWNCPRDIPEDRLYEKLESLASKIGKLDHTIFCVHVPPYGSGLDVAPQLNNKLKPVLGPGGAPVMIPVGSTAVKQAIEKYQPFLSLHGHIHESRGVTKIGRTLCLNPGSEYAEGILRGALIDIEKGKVKDYLLTAG
ncbi:metallophosphoesterase [Candidatus Bathyarchaeota archaeon]|nr:metallophosphoesterase [Candidatus Bathyarchaeota archaeon]